MEKLSKKDLEMLNSKVGLRKLFENQELNLQKVVDETRFEEKMKDLQVEMVKLQSWVIENRMKVVIIFEGRDAAGKGGAIGKMTQHINPRYYRIVALPKPTEDEQGQWYFQRYVNALPRPGEIVFFDRSWYNRAMVEPVNKFCTHQEYKIFMSQVNEFEKMIQESGTYLLKIYFSITKTEQEKRLNSLRQSELKKWKLTPLDERAIELWSEYTKYKDKMLTHTHTKECPWKIMDANVKNEIRLEALKYVLDSIPYK